MPHIIANLHETRGFNTKTGRLVLLALSGALLTAGSVPSNAQTPISGHSEHTRHHRSIWAIRWNEQHPAQAAIYHHKLGSRRHTSSSQPRFKTASSVSKTLKSGLSLQPLSTHGSATHLASFVQPLPTAPYGINTLQPMQSTPALKPVLMTKLQKVVRQTGSPEDVTLDFVSADINDVLKALSLQTHTNIVSGTDVKGNVTVSLAHVTLEEALDIITKLSGYQFAKIGNTYVVGSPASISQLTASGAAMAPPATAVISFNYSQADDLANVIKQLIPNIKTSPGKAAGTSTSGGVLVVTGTEADVEQARLIVAQAESALSKGIAASRTDIYNIKYASADDLQSVLSRLVPNLIVTPGPSQGFNLKAPTTADASGTTSTTTSYGATGGGAAVTGSVGDIATKPTTNSLLLTGSDTDISHARAILAQVDVRPVQLSYDTRVTEINLNNEKNVGLNWDFSGASTRIGEEPDNVVNTPPTLGDNGKSGFKRLLDFGSFGRTSLSDFLNLQLNLLETSGDVKTLADPNISAVDGQPASVFIGDNITYVQSITSSTTGENITTATVSAGIKLFVTGKVNNDGYITLNIHPEVSTVTFTTAAGGSVLPQIHTREATTTLRVKDGDTIAIGGLINESDVKTVNKVPLLGDLPFFGNLFRSTDRTHSRDEVVIFLKVAVQKDGA